MTLSHDAGTKLETYISELQHWKRRINLTSLDGTDLCRRLIAEPCWIGLELQMSGRLLDLGSGNGSPGIPLLLSCGLQRVHLVEVRQKRAAFLRHLAGVLREQERVVVHKVRLEELGTPPEGVDWITLQGVKPVESLVEALKQLFRPTTRVVWITSKGVSLPASKLLSVPDSNTVALVLQLDQF